MTSEASYSSSYPTSEDVPLRLSYVLSTRQWLIASGSFMLFVTNLAAIVVSADIVLLMCRSAAVWLGLAAVQFIDVSSQVGTSPAPVAR